MAHEIILKPSAQRDLDTLPIKEVNRIAQRFLQLANDPRPFGVQKLTGTNEYRIRSGKYRVLYLINDKENEILIYRIKHRKDVYR